LSYREYRLRLEWLEYNEERTDSLAYYLAQIAHVVKLYCGGKSSRLTDFLNPFKRLTKQPKAPSKDELDAYSKGRVAHLIKAARERDKTNANSK